MQKTASQLKEIKYWLGMCVHTVDAELESKGVLSFLHQTNLSGTEAVWFRHAFTHNNNMVSGLTNKLCSLQH